MIKERTYSVNIMITVHDRAELRKAATKYARENESMTAKEYNALRKTHSDPVEADLIMLFDPGVSPIGTQIDHTDVVAHSL